MNVAILQKKTKTKNKKQKQKKEKKRSKRSNPYQRKLDSFDAVIDPALQVAREEEAGVVL